MGNCFSWISFSSHPSPDRSHAQYSSSEEVAPLLNEEQSRPEEPRALTFLQGLFAVVLIDGDGLIFNDSHLVDGRRGGRVAAQMLRNSLKMSLLLSTEIPMMIQVYLSKSGLAGALERGGLDVDMDAFWQGFGEAHELNSIIDVGRGDQAADTKLKAVLSIYSKNHQCHRIICGFSHDKGYISSLKNATQAMNRRNSMSSSSSSGEHIVLLRGPSAPPNDIAVLQLPEKVFPKLFRPSYIPPARKGSNTPPTSPTTTDSPKSNGRKQPSGKTPLDSSKRYVNQKPKICYDFYVRAQKCQNKTCDFSHDYNLSPTQINEMIDEYKGYDCYEWKAKGTCSKGDLCRNRHGDIVKK